jgi:hypothetical protein
MPLVCHLDETQEESLTLCVSNATILVLILFCVPMLILGKWPNLKRIEEYLNNHFAHFF